MNGCGRGCALLTGFRQFLVRQGVRYDSDSPLIPAAIAA